MGKFIIVGAGDWTGAPHVQPGDFLIAADGGYPHLLQAGLTPHLVIGDFDSAPPPQGLNTITLPVEKDDTDTLAAIRLGLEKGYKQFELYGGTGGRLDHTLANIQCLDFLSRQGARGTLYAKDVALTCLRNGEITFDAGMEGTLSVFSLTEACRGVTLEGLKYPLSDGTIHSHFPIGVSNSFTGRPARVAVKEGSLLVVYPIAR